MYRFFVEECQAGRDFIIITGPDVNHISNVLRMKRGEQVRVSDGTGTDYLCEIGELEPEEVSLRVIRAQEGETELPGRIVLFQGLPKSDKLELIIQKAVELGAHEIVPVAMKRSVVKVEPKKEDVKKKRWNAISESAAKQSKRLLIPQVSAAISWKEALKQMGQMDICLVPYELAEGMEGTRKAVSRIQPGMSIGIVIGPEGGFAEEEIAGVLEQGACVISLGKRILRTETAGLTALSILMYHLEGGL